MFYDFSTSVNAVGSRGAEELHEKCRKTWLNILSMNVHSNFSFHIWIRQHAQQKYWKIIWCSWTLADFVKAYWTFGGKALCHYDDTICTCETRSCSTYKNVSFLKQEMFIISHRGCWDCATPSMEAEIRQKLLLQVKSTYKDFFPPNATGKTDVTYINHKNTIK